MKKLLMILAGGVFLLFTACQWETIEPIIVEPPQGVSFAEDVAPLFEAAGCTACHGNSGGLDLHADKSYAGLINGRVDTANPEASKLWVHILENHGSSSNLNAEQRATILSWIKEGAKDN